MQASRKKYGVSTRALGAGALTAASVAFAAIGAAPASAATTASVQGGVLHVTGDRASDKLAFVSVDPSTVLVDVGEDGTTNFAFDKATFSAVDVQAGGGDDEVRVENGALTDKAVTIDGGAGADTLLGGDGAEMLIGGAGADVVDGNRGNDTAQLGDGADAFVWDPGDGSDAVDGGAGRDSLRFHGSNAAESMSLTGDGPRALLHRDVADIDTELGGIESVDIAAAGSADTITVGDLAGTDVKDADVDLSGDGAADHVVALGTAGDDAMAAVQDGDATAITGLAADVRVTGDVADRVVADGGAGADTLRYSGTAGADTIGIAPDGATSVAFGVTSVPVDAATENLVVAGLDGDDRIAGQNGMSQDAKLTIQGGSGDDVLGGGDGDDVLSGGPGDDVVDGNRGADTARLGSGDDTFDWDPGDGSDIVEGQQGDDTLAFNGSNAAEAIALHAAGGRMHLTRDVGAVTTDTGGFESVAIRALGSPDAITVGDLRQTGVKTVDVSLAGFDGNGDEAPDTITVEGTDRADHVQVTRSGDEVVTDGLAAETRISGSEPAADTLAVHTLAGIDSVTVAPDVGDEIKTLVDLGADG